MLDIKYKMYPDLLVSLRGWILPLGPVVLETFLPLWVSIPEVKSKGLVVGMWHRVSKLVAGCSFEGLHLRLLNKVK